MLASGDTAGRVYTSGLSTAASQGGGRLLVLDTDGKVQVDTDSASAQRHAAGSLREVHTILARRRMDADYGFHS